MDKEQQVYKKLQENKMKELENSCKLKKSKEKTSETIVLEDLRIKLDEAKIQSQKNLMDERQKNLEKISLKRKEFEDKVSKDILSSESKINKSKSSALVDISSVAEDIAEEMLNNLFVKKVEKKDLSKFSKNLN